MILKNNKTETSAMLDDAGISALHGKLHANSVHKAIEQAEMFLKDEIERAKSLNQRALDFLKLIIALISIISALSLFSDSHINVKEVFLGFIISMIFLAFAIFFFTYMQRPTKFGSLGRSPNTWLQKGIIDGDDKSHITTLTYILRDYQAGIDVSVGNNNKKARLLELGLWLFIATPMPVLINLLITYFSK